MVLCDTNIFISAFNGRQDAIDQLNDIGLERIGLSAISVMELLQGSIVYQIPLHTYNLKDFDFIPEVTLYSNK